MLDVLVFFFWLLFIGLALFGGLVLAAVLRRPRETERQRVAREAREAERQITDIGRQARAAILNEAMRRAQGKRRTRSSDYPNAIDGEWS